MSVYEVVDPDGRRSTAVYVYPDKSYRFSTHFHGKTFIYRRFISPTISAWADWLYALENCVGRSSLSNYVYVCTLLLLPSSVSVHSAIRNSGRPDAGESTRASLRHDTVVHRRQIGKHLKVGTHYCQVTWNHVLSCEFTRLEKVRRTVINILLCARTFMFLFSEYPLFQLYVTSHFKTFKSIKISYSLYLNSYFFYFNCKQLVHILCLETYYFKLCLPQKKKKTVNIS